MPPSWVISHCIRVPLKVTTDGKQEVAVIHRGKGHELNKVGKGGRTMTNPKLSFVEDRRRQKRLLAASSCEQVGLIKNSLENFYSNTDLSGSLFRHKNPVENRFFK